MKKYHSSIFRFRGVVLSSSQKNVLIDEFRQMGIKMKPEIFEHWYPEVVAPLHDDIFGEAFLFSFCPLLPCFRKSTVDYMTRPTRWKESTLGRWTNVI